MPSADFATFEIGAMEPPLLASPRYQHLHAMHTPFHFIPDQLQVPEFGQGDVINPTGNHPPMSQTYPTVSGAGAAGPLPRPVVASPAQISAANRRRTKPIPGRFVCVVCPQDFTTQHNLRNHINSHLKKKDYKCVSCGKSFTTRSSLNRHSKKCRANTEALAA